LNDSLDRFHSVRAPIESLGGKIKSVFFAVDSFDVLAISEFATDISSSEISIAFSAGGEIAQIHTTRLLDASQALEAARNAGPCGYRSGQRLEARAATAG
jgi:uncharacterized protein with GYD domain